MLNAEKMQFLKDRPHRRLINKTTALPHQNEYTLALEGDLKAVAFSEVRAPQNKGVWREKVFNCAAQTPLDLEIGTGTGTYFAHHAAQYPDRKILGIELKYKPLIQTIRGLGYKLES